MVTEKTIKNEDKQVNFLVPQRIKERFQQEADLAFQYGWIKSPNMTQLFIWTVDYYLAEGLKNHIMKRRLAIQNQIAGEEKNG